LRSEAHDHGRVVGGLGACEVAQHLLGDRMALVLEDFQRERNVVRGDRTAVVKLDARPHQETVGQSVGRDAHGPRGKAIERIRLVLGAHHQAGEGELHALGAVTLENEAVE
jgi:hypothetical protein